MLFITIPVLPKSQILKNGHSTTVISFADMLHICISATTTLFNIAATISVQFHLYYKKINKIVVVLQILEGICSTDI